jgi:hypothetical protein
VRVFPGGLAKCRCSKKTFEASHSMITTSSAKKRNTIVSFLGIRKPPAQSSAPSPPPLSPTMANAEFKRVRDAEMEQEFVVTALEERLIDHQHQVGS